MTRYSLGIIDPPEGGAAFLPTDFSDLLFWFDASDSGTITESGGEVSQWDDKGPNGYDVANATGSEQPNVDSLGGFDSLFFDGGDVLINEGLSLTVEPNTIFAVFSTDAIGVGAGRIMSLDANDLYIQRSASTFQTNHAATSGGSGAVNLGALLTVDVPVATIVRNKDSGPCDVLTDDDTTGSDAAVGTLQSAFSDLLIGAKTTGAADGWLGHLFEIGVYAQALSDGDRTTLMDYLKLKWGL